MKKQPLQLLKADPDNPRTISDEAAKGLGASMEELGDLSVIVWNEKTGELAAGHQRMAQLKKAGAKDWTRNGEGTGYIEHPKTGERFAIRIVQWDRATQRLANIVANNPELQGEFTGDAARQIRELIEDEQRERLLLDDLARSIDAQLARATSADSSGSLAATFGVPPFSVLDARQGYWQDRKRAWLSLGIKSEIGRGANLLGMSETILEPDPAKRAANKKRETPSLRGGAHLRDDDQPIRQGR